MKLENKKELAARALGVAKSRIIFNSQRLPEIKEAITKQDMKDLKVSGVIMIREKKGRRKIISRKTRRREGSFKNRALDKKRIYINLTRKLRRYISYLKARDMISRGNYLKLRKLIRSSEFKSLSHMKERIAILEETNKIGGISNAENAKKKKKRSKN